MIFASMIPAVRTIWVIARDGALVLIDSVSLGFLKAPRSIRRRDDRTPRSKSKSQCTSSCGCGTSFSFKVAGNSPHPHELRPLGFVAATSPPREVYGIVLAQFHQRRLIGSMRIATWNVNSVKARL